MKLLPFSLALMPVFFFALPSHAAEDANAIVAKIEATLSPKNAKAEYEFTNHRTDGTTVTYEVTFSIRNSERSHGVFRKPERDKGREVLRLGDDLWSFAPSVGRVIRIADRDSFAGGDFSNADILRVDWLNNYSVSILKDLPRQRIIELKAKNDNSTYARMLLWVDKQSGLPVQQQYYDSKGTLLKRALYGEPKTFGPILRPSRIKMENVITKQSSELKVNAMEFVNSLPDSRFSVDNLGK